VGKKKNTGVTRLEGRPNKKTKNKRWFIPKRCLASGGRFLGNPSGDGGVDLHFFHVGPEMIKVKNRLPAQPAGRGGVL